MAARDRQYRAWGKQCRGFLGKSICAASATLAEIPDVCRELPAANESNLFVQPQRRLICGRHRQAGGLAPMRRKFQQRSPQQMAAHPGIAMRGRDAQLRDVSGVLGDQARERNPAQRTRRTSKAA